MTTVSVQIVTYNSEKDIKNCLTTVNEQTFPIEKIIVIDNNSNDKTLKVLKDFPSVKVVSNQINNGFAGGHNQGFQLTSSDYVLVLNPDVRLHRDYVKNIIEVMEKKDDVGMATGKLYRDINHGILDSTGIVMKKNRRAFDRGSGEVDNGQYDMDIDIFGISAAAAVYRRKMIDDISINGQFFDESFFAYKEDVDVSWRAQIFGWKSEFVPSAIAEHSRGWQEKNRKDIPLFIRQKSYINRYFYILKNDQVVYYVLHLPFILFYDLLTFMYALLKEPKLLSIWGFFIKEYRAVLEKRNIIMSNRKLPNKQIYSYFKGYW